MSAYPAGALLYSPDQCDILYGAKAGARHADDLCLREKAWLTPISQPWGFRSRWHIRIKRNRRFACVAPDDSAQMLYCRPICLLYRYIHRHWSMGFCFSCRSFLYSCIHRHWSSRLCFSCRRRGALRSGRSIRYRRIVTDYIDLPGLTSRQHHAKKQQK